MNEHVPYLVCEDCSKKGRKKESIKIEQLTNNMKKDYKHKYCLFCGKAVEKENT